MWQFTTFMSKSFTIWDHFFPLLFPNDSEYLKCLDIGLWEVGTKRLLSGVRNCDGKTDKQTDKKTNIRTFSLKESITPEGQSVENLSPPPSIFFVRKKKLNEFPANAATIRIGWEIQCLPYVGFFLFFFSLPEYDTLVWTSNLKFTSEYIL